MKEALYEYCEMFVSERIQRIQKQIEDLRDSLNTETKSTAGDKHETGRAMMQLELEKLGDRLFEVEKMKKVLERISIHQKSNKIGLGSLVETDKANYFISISAGKFQSDGNTVFCISTVTPISKLLLGKSGGDSVYFNGVAQTILGVY